MGIAKRMHSKVRQGGSWRANGVDLLSGVGVNPDGTIYLKVSPPKPEPKAAPARSEGQPLLPSLPRERRQRKPGKLKPRVGAR